MSKNYLLAMDQGTTGTTVLVVDVTNPQDTSVIGRKTVDFQQHYPKTGWVEHDLNEIWQTVERATIGAMAGAKATDPGFDQKKIIGLGITNQRETLCIFDRKTSEPHHRGIVWQCKRSTEICERLRQSGVAPTLKEKTGLVCDPYFSGTKLTWVLENVADVAKSIGNGQSLVGTIDTYLIHRLSGGSSHATEASNASRTLLYNIETGEWDKELLKILGVPNADCLPKVLDSAGEFGRTKGLGFLPDGIPISGVLGDQQAALAGQTCFEVGEAKCTFGTGAFLLLNIGEEKLSLDSGLLTTVAWQLKGKRSYAIEGASFIAGASIQFLRDQMGFLDDASHSESMAQGAVGAPEVYFVPALSGLGAPYWNPKAQGGFLGLTRGTTKAQLVRAALEGMAFQVNDLVNAMRQEFTKPLTILRVDGGAAANDLLMQIQADYLGIPVDRPVNLETTAFGAALFAGLGVGLYAGVDELKGVRKTQTIFNPQTTVATKQQLQGWSRAVKAIEVFAG
jgi:glycerol kinase